MTGEAVETGEATTRHLRQVARGGAIGLVGAAVSAVAGFALVVVVTNAYSPSDAGLFFALTSAFLLLTAITSLGADTGMARFMLRYEAHDRRGDILPTLRTALWPTMALSVIVAFAVSFFSGPLARVMGLDGESASRSLVVLAALVPFATYNTLALAGTRAFGHMRLTVLIDKILRPVAQPLLILLVSVTSASLILLTVAWSVPYAIAAVISLVLFRRFLERRDVHGHEPTVSRRELVTDFWKFTWPRSIARVSQMAIQRIDILLIAALRSPSEAAIYTAATRFVALGQFGTQATQQVLQPKFTALLAAGDHDSLREVHQVATAWNILLAWPLYIVVASAPVAYLGVFGQGYASFGAVLVVILMSAGMLFAVSSGPVDTLLLMSGRSTASLLNSLVALIIDVVLCVLLIPSLGIVGAAIAWAVAVSVRALLAVVQIRRSLHVVSFGIPALIAMAANVVCLAVPLGLVGVLVQPNLIGMALSAALCLPLYGAALWCARDRLMLAVLGDLFRSRGSRRKG